MSSINISLPEHMREWVESTVSSGSFGTVSEYVRSLIREDQTRKAKDLLDAKLIQALESGPEAEMSREDWEAMRAEVRRLLFKKGA